MIGSWWLRVFVLRTLLSSARLTLPDNVARQSSNFGANDYVRRRKVSCAFAMLLIHPLIAILMFLDSTNMSLQKT